jgi:phosphopantetheine adenylyltransferase
MVNDEKDYLFDHDTRFAIVDKAVGGKRGIKVVKSEGMTYALAQEFGADTLVRGYRDEKDLAYEKEMEAFNEAHGIKTDLIRIEGFESYSSTHVRENLLKGDFSGIPSSVKEIIADALKKR